MSDLAQTVRAFGAGHPLQILITAGLVAYSSAKKKLTPNGIIAAIVTAVVHMLHPWGVFFYLLVTFFLAGTIATKVSIITQLLTHTTFHYPNRARGFLVSRQTKIVMHKSP